MINWKDWRNWAALALPIGSGYLTSSLSGMDSSAGEVVVARPPSWVFAAIWPILYLLVGFAWVLLRNMRDSPRGGFSGNLWGFKEIDFLFLLNVAGLVSWIVVYAHNDDKKGAVYVLLVTFVLSLVTFMYAFMISARVAYMLAPYVGWLLFALMMNFEEVNYLG